MTEAQLRADIVEVGRRMYARGYTASNDGNISVRLDDGRSADDAEERVQRVHDAGHDVRHRSRRQEARRRARSLIGDADASRGVPAAARRAAVVHAHPPIATGFAVAGIPLDRAVLAEVVTTLGSMPIAEYATPSTRELPDAVRKYVKAHDGMLLANHGALTIGADVFAAYYKMETIEHFAQISLVARLLGGERLLSREEVSGCRDCAELWHLIAGADLPRTRRGGSPSTVRWCRRRVGRLESGSCPTPTVKFG